MTITNNNFFRHSYLLGKSSVDYLAIRSTDPYEKGYIHGRAFATQISETAGLIDFVIQSSTCLISVTDPDTGKETTYGEIKEHITQVETAIIDHASDEIKAELEGIAKGSGVPFETIAKMNAMPISYFFEMACTAIVARNQSDGIESLSVDNSAASKRDSNSPATTIETTLRSEASFFPALREVSKDNTARSKVFDPKSLSIDLSLPTGSMTPTLDFYHLPSDLLFGENFTAPSIREKHSTDDAFHLAHNLDFRFPSNHLILVREAGNGTKVCSLTFPGLIGVHEGMNSHGVAISTLTLEDITPMRENPEGYHNYFAFYETLCETTSQEAFLSKLETYSMAAPMNLIACDPNSACSLEWHLSTKTPGWDHIAKL